MTYIWYSSDNYPERLFALYNRQKSPNRFLFLDGVYIKEKLLPCYFKVNATINEIIQYNALDNNGDMPLIDKKVQYIVDDIAEFDVQYFDAVIECKDGILDTYKVMNITNTVHAINHSISKYDLIEGSSAILGFKFLSLKPDCLAMCEIARDYEYKSHILVSQKLYDAFKINKIKGITLITEEQFNNIGKVRIP